MFLSIWEVHRICRFPLSLRSSIFDARVLSCESVEEEEDEGRAASWRKKTKKKKHRWTIKLWIKRRKCGDKSARTVGAIRTLAAAQTERKKKMQRGRKADDATGCRRSTSGPAAKPSTKCICDIYIYAVYIYIQILDSLRQADLSGRHQPFSCCASGSSARLCVWLHGSYI